MHSAPRMSADLGGEFLSHCLQILVGEHVEINGDYYMPCRNPAAKFGKLVICRILLVG